MSRWWPRLADRPIRTKLTLLLVPPVVMILGVSGLFAYSAQAAASRAEQARQLVTAGAIAGQLTAALQHERAAADLVFARGSAAAAVTQYQQQAHTTDAVRFQLSSLLDRAAVPAGWQQLIERIGVQLADLPLLREQVRNGRDAAVSVVTFRYRALIADLGSYRSGLSQLSVDADTATGLRATATLSDGIEALGLLQVNVLPVLGAGKLSAASQQQIVAANAGFGEALEEFRQLAPPGWQTRLAAQASDPVVANGERLQAIAASSLPGTRPAVTVNARSWVTAINARMDQLHALEATLDTELVTAVTKQRDDQRRELLLLTTLVVLCLLVLVAVGWWITRSMTRSLRTLTDGATAMAATTLPDMVDQLVTGRLEPAAAASMIDRAGALINVGGADEIGAVARAFNQVAGTAADLAATQAQAQAVTTSVAEAIARNMQHVSHQVTTAIDVLEREEQDPARLQQLYDLDQKATGLHRLISNLFVFTGQPAGEPTKAPVPLLDVVRGAVSRVNGAYDRVDYQQVDRITLIDSWYAEEIVHVLTELLDNAVQFSPPDVQVQILAQHVGDQLHMQIIDFGPGIPDAQLPELRARLDTFHLTPVTARHKGLPVVGRIAKRLGVQVTLRSESFGSGTRVDVVLPAKLFTIDADQDRPAFAVTAVPVTVPPVTAPIVAAPMLPTGPAAIDPPTQQLRQLGGDGPPQWPLLPAAPAGEPPRLQVYEEVAGWFAPSPVTGPAAPSPGVPPEWTAAASIAAASAGTDSEPGSGERTAHGLPVRRPGQYVIPQLANPFQIPAQRDPHRVTRNIASLAASVRASRTP